jgi:hypothetical protein
LPRKYIPTGRPRGRPKKPEPEHKSTEADRRSVEAMAGYGIPEDDIARVIGISSPALSELYRDELDLGHVKANTAVAQNLFKIATGSGPGAATASIFWLRMRAGWSDPVPAPKPPAADKPLGKKEEAALAAIAAGEASDDDWAGDLATPGMMN